MWNDKRQLAFNDPFPDLELARIEPISLRVKALLARSNNALLHTDFIQIGGAQFILEAADYHYKNYLSNLSNCPDPWSAELARAKHDAVAWLNSVGQFNKFVVNAGKKWTLFSTPIACRLVRFRNKYAAHRSIDDPRKESDTNLMFQAISFSSFATSFDPRGKNLPDNPGLKWFHRTFFLQFKMQFENGWESINIELDHLAFMEEAYQFYSTLLSEAM